MNVLNRLRAALAAARAVRPDLSEEASEEVLQQILAALGGEQVILPKTTQGRAGRPSIPREVQAAVYRDALGTDSNAAITRKHGISRATLYRLVKRGPGEGP
jgi:Mor transcription activator family